MKVRFNPDKPFQFSDYKNISSEANDIIGKLYKELYSELKRGITQEWNIENDNIDKIVNMYLNGDRTNPLYTVYYARNREALKSFFSRNNANGFNLSARVWNLTTQFKNEIELAIDTALLEGTSATKLSKQIREYLKEPDKLFRRVRYSRGELVLSKRAKGYHPGQGVYRSSFKNALRVARTEINMAYRESDMQRWQKLDFVIGYEVRRSNREYDCDMCASLTGRYPKWFNFTGWHPNCLCFAVPILMPQKDFLEISNAHLKGGSAEEKANKYQIKKLPSQFDKWMHDHDEKYKKAKKRGTIPYWIRDNEKVILDNVAGLKYDK